MAVAVLTAACADNPVGVTATTGRVLPAASKELRGRGSRNLDARRGGLVFTLDRDGSELRDNRGHSRRLDATALSKLDYLFDAIERGDSLAAYVTRNPVIRRDVGKVAPGTRTRHRSLGRANAMRPGFRKSATGPVVAGAIGRSAQGHADVAGAKPFGGTFADVEYNGSLCEDLSYTLLQETQTYNNARSALVAWLGSVGLTGFDVNEWGDMVWDWRHFIGLSNALTFDALAYDVFQAHLALDITAAMWNTYGCWTWQYQNSNPLPSGGGGDEYNNCHTETWVWEISYDGGYTWEPYMYQDVTVCYMEWAI